MISAVILTKNEEKNILKCINSLKFCDEIIVIDDDSEDKTVEIAKKIGANVFIHSLDNDFSKQRNFGLNKASGEWVLFIDADEQVPSSLREDIIQSINNPINKYDGFYIKRKDIMWGRELKYGEAGNIKLLRLARKDSGKWIGKVHEVWKMNGKTKDLNNPIVHYPHQSISEFLQEINFYTDLRAKELFEAGKKVNSLSILLYPKLKFVVNYFIKFGFMDRIPGFIYAIMMSLHSFLVRGKLWLLWQKK